MTTANRLYRRVMMSVMPMKITATDDSGPIHRAQVRGFPCETIDAMPVLQLYGIASHAQPGSDAMAIFASGDRSNGVIVATGNQAARPRDQKPGEVTIFTDEGDTIALQRDHNVVVKTETVTVDAPKETTITSPTIKFGAGSQRSTPGDVAMDNSNLTLALDPTVPKHAVTKEYCDANRGGGAAGPPGPPGPEGPTGPQGPAGATGPAGASGAQGPPGPTGPAGPKGDTGAAGATGPAGTPGAAGATGPQGAQGPKGDVGATGAQGPQGPAGADSTVPGPQGPPGATGATGPQGPIGLTGSTGPQGPPGADSTVPGPVGPQGPIGNTGPQGPQGLTGATGPAGADSTVPGPVGPQGPIGNTGPQGPIGLTGATGPQGPAGADSTVPGPVGPQGPKGDVGATGAQGPQGLPGATGATGPAGADSTVPGPQGPPGATGATGAQGPQGVAGNTGATGPQGPAGADSTVPGPVGPAGATGPVGPAGAAGATGPAGPTAVSADANNFARLGSDRLTYVPQALPLTGGTVTGAIVLSTSTVYTGFATFNPNTSVGYGFYYYNDTNFGLGSMNGSGQGTNWSNAIKIGMPNGTLSIPGGGGLKLGAVNSDPSLITGGIEMYPGYGGFGVTSGTLNYNWTGTHQFLQGTKPIMRISSGLIMQTPLTLAADPTTALQAATKQYIDNAIASVTAKIGSSQWDIGQLQQAAVVDPLDEMRATIATLTARIVALENRIP